MLFFALIVEYSNIQIFDTTPYLEVNLICLVHIVWVICCDDSLNCVASGEWEFTPSAKIVRQDMTSEAGAV